MLVGVLFTTILVPGLAQASIFDWLGMDSSNETDFVSPIVARNSDWSFDKLYGSIQGINMTKTLPMIQNSSIAQFNVVPESSKEVVTKKPKTYTILASAYSSTPDQTDSTPFITASGTYVRDGIIAANFLPMGTVIRIPELYGNKTFVVEDRMNKRYTYKIDIWFPDRESALIFGVKKVTIEIVS